MTAPKLVVGQSGGPTQVINASLAGVLDEAARTGAFPEVWGLRHGIEGAIGDKLVRLDQLDHDQRDRLATTPAAALGSCRHKLTEHDYQTVLETFQRHNVRWFCYIGGNDSMDTTQHIAALAQRSGYNLAVFGVPKTIDNDLVETDHCPGYGSAARYWAIATQEATLDLAAMRTYDRVAILECMGRNAGWLAWASALFKRDDAGAPHAVLTPERAFDERAFLARVDAQLGRSGYCTVVTSETIKDAQGEFVARSHAGRDKFGHPVVVAVAETLAQLVTDRLGVKARAIKPGTLQRTSAAHVSVVDRAEARAAGAAAAAHLAAGESGGMITLLRGEQMGAYSCHFGVVALEQVASRERPMPETFLGATDGQPSTAFLDYARPLIGPAPEPYFALA